MFETLELRTAALLRLTNGTSVSTTRQGAVFQGTGRISVFGGKVFTVSSTDELRHGTDLRTRQIGQAASTPRHHLKLKLDARLMLAQYFHSLHCSRWQQSLVRHVEENPPPDTYIESFKALHKLACFKTSPTSQLLTAVVAAAAPTLTASRQTSCRKV